MRSKEISFSEGALLVVASLLTLLAFVGIAGTVWHPIHFVRGQALAYSTFLTPAFFTVALMDLVRYGWSWKRIFAIMLLLVSLGLVFLSFHEILSAVPFSFYE
jgi:hypothetical protein